MDVSGDFFNNLEFKKKAVLLRQPHFLIF